MQSAPFQVIKLVGISPAGLVGLHKFLADFKASHPDPTTFDHEPYFLPEQGRLVNASLVELLSAKYEKEHDSYTVELRIPFYLIVSHPNSSKETLFVYETPRRVMDGLYDALEHFPKREDVVRQSGD